MRKLKLASRNTKEPTRQDIFMAEIAQENREARWTPISEPQINPTFDPDEILERASRYVILDTPIPRWRRLLRWFLS
jgi:hypothetical protein